MSRPDSILKSMICEMPALTSLSALRGSSDGRSLGVSLSPTVSVEIKDLI